MSTRDYEIILSPGLGIAPDDFAATWNEHDEAREIGPARVEQTRGAQYDLTVPITIIITILGGATANLISEQIMKVLEKRGKPGTPGKHTHIEHLKKPDGTDSFIVDIDEK